MPETFEPISWEDGSGGGTPITAAQLNRIETGVESMDDRITAVEDDVTELESRLDGVDGVSNIGAVGSSVALTPGSGNGTAKLITLGANCTITFNNGSANGRVKTLELVISQDSTGGRLVTWPASVRWPDDTTPTLSTAAHAVDRLVFTTYNDGTTWYGDLVGKGYA